MSSGPNAVAVAVFIDEAEQVFSSRRSMQDYHSVRVEAPKRMIRLDHVTVYLWFDHKLTAECLAFVFPNLWLLSFVRQAKNDIVKAFLEWTQGLQSRPRDAKPIIVVTWSRHFLVSHCTLTPNYIR